VVGIFTQPVFDPPVFKNTISLVLDGIQDPGNLGSIIRSADWFGIRTIVCSPDCADNFNAKVVQSTMGSITRVQLMYTDLPAFVADNALPDLYAATLNGKSVYGTGPVKEGMIIIGNESKGISDALLKKAKHRITIPRKGQAESLNAGVATGIMLSHLVT
jgi:TrmH family RNA methyltransferase